MSKENANKIKAILDEKTPSAEHQSVEARATSHKSSAAEKAHADWDDMEKNLGADDRAVERYTASRGTTQKTMADNFLN